MRFAYRCFFSVVAFLVWGVSLSHASVRNVSTPSQLQSALDSAVAGDEIVLADGIYSGEFYIRNNAGTSSNPITVRAANKHQAILQGYNECDYKGGLSVSRSWWKVQDLKFLNHGRPIYITASNVEIGHNILDNFGTEGIRVEGVNQTNIHENVIAFSRSCHPNGYDGAGIWLVANADQNWIINNIIISLGTEYSLYGAIRDYNIYIANNSDDNLVQGNMTMGEEVAFIILAGQSQSSADRNIVRDNAFLWASGGSATADCTDNQSEIINNIFYGLFHSSWSTKGNKDGAKGQHVLQGNLLYTNEFSRRGADIGTGGEPFCSNPVVAYKIRNTVKDNLFYSDTPQSGAHILWNVVGQTNSSYPSLQVADHNMFWAPGSASTWTTNYAFNVTDIHSAAQQPIFTHAVQGDFSLATGSPGKDAASNGTDIGIHYNQYLKKTWLAKAFNLSTQRKENLTTSTSFAVNPNRWYEVHFYIPDTYFNGVETFTIEGVQRQRNIKAFGGDPTWTQPGGPARWMSLGRHKATDGTLNISWSNPGSASKIFIRQFPTADEAYQWIAQSQSSDQHLSAPTKLRVIQNP